MSDQRQPTFDTNPSKPKLRLPAGCLGHALPRLRAEGAVSLRAHQQDRSGRCREGAVVRPACDARHRALRDRAIGLARHGQPRGRGCAAGQRRRLSRHCPAAHHGRGCRIAQAGSAGLPRRALQFHEAPAASRVDRGGDRAGLATGRHRLASADPHGEHADRADDPDPEAVGGARGDRSHRTHRCGTGIGAGAVSESAAPDARTTGSG